MTKKDFCEVVKEMLHEQLPEDYEGCKVDVIEVNKNNGQVWTGLTVKKDEAYAVPILYLDSFYDNYEVEEWDGISNQFDVVVKQIADDYVELIDNMPEIPDIGKYENIKEKLRLKLVNTEANTELLKEVVNEYVGLGLSLVAYVDLDENSFFNVTKDYAASNGIGQDDLIEQAKQNMEKYVTPVLYRMEDVLFGENPQNLLESGDTAAGNLFILTMEGNLLGSAVICIPGVAEAVYKAVGKDYFILPSSIHELLIVPGDRGYSPDELRDMVQSVNSSMVSPEERLSDEVMFYSGYEKAVTAAAWNVKD